MTICTPVVVLAAFIAFTFAQPRREQAMPPSPEPSMMDYKTYSGTGGSMGPGPEASGEPGMPAPNQPTRNTKCPIWGKFGADLPWDYNPYSGIGPDNWGDKYPHCNEDAQSPIDFPVKVRYAPKHMGPRPMLGKALMEIQSTTMNFRLKCVKSGTCGMTVFDGEIYKVDNMHFHAPSEHTLGGRYYPLELHIVHTGPGGKGYRVISVMFDYKKTDSYASKVYRGVRREYGMNKAMYMLKSYMRKGMTKVHMPLDEIVDGTKGFCSYEGSLTTPPCTGPVRFYMSLNVLSVSKRQVHGFAVAAGAGYDGTNRPLQPLNGREITCFLAKDRRFADRMYDEDRVWGMSADGDMVPGGRRSEWDMDMMKDVMKDMMKPYGKDGQDMMDEMMKWYGKDSEGVIEELMNKHGNDRDAFVEALLRKYGKDRQSMKKMMKEKFGEDAESVIDELMKRYGKEAEGVMDMIKRYGGKDAEDKVGSLLKRFSGKGADEMMGSLMNMIDGGIMKGADMLTGGGMKKGDDLMNGDEGTNEDKDNGEGPNGDEPVNQRLPERMPEGSPESEEDARMRMRLLRERLGLDVPAV